MHNPAQPAASIQRLAFTIRYQGRSLRLTSEVDIFPAFQLPEPIPEGKKYTALYDTGATHSTVSPQVVSDLNLPIVGAMTVGVGGGSLTTTTHLVNIGLPNQAMFQVMQVCQMVVAAGIDVIIGMDILGLGDFTVTHNSGNTMFSFCIPSRRDIDFVTELNDDQKIAFRTGRNEPCGCGSGKKYKKCHGA